MTGGAVRARVVRLLEPPAPLPPAGRISALLGADSFEFGTSALMMLRCVMAKNCNVRCPAGITTNAEAFDGDPRALAQYLLGVAHEVREILAGLGLRLRPVEASGQSGLGDGGTRKDAFPVSPENAGDFGDASLFVVNATDEEVEEGRARQPLLATLPAFAEGRVYGLGPESFRLDRFAADSVLDRLEASAG